MLSRPPIRLGIRLVLSLMVLFCVAVSAGTVHELWRRTAVASSRALAETLIRQVADRVRAEVNARITGSEAAFGAIRSIFQQRVIATRDDEKREFVFLSQIQAQPSLSWIVFGSPDGDFFASHKLGDNELETIEIIEQGGHWRARADRYGVLPTSTEFKTRTLSDSDYRATNQRWYQAGIKADVPSWVEITEHPGRARAAIAYAGPVDVDRDRKGVLAVMMDFDRLSQFLGGLVVGDQGSAFVMASDGHIIADPDFRADELKGTDLSDNPLMSTVGTTGKHMAAGETALALRIEREGAYDAVSITPLGFLDWSVVVVIPEREFLGEIEDTRMRLVIGLGLFIMLIGIAAAIATGRLIARPLRALVTDLSRIERFDLERVLPRPSPILEFDALSSATVRMAVGLTSFGRYMPRDLVRGLIADGVEAAPGGTLRPLTVMFVDLAGFTGLAESLGEKIVPVIGAYLQAASLAVESHGGTIDKFIGDAVMAFWGAPHPFPDHAAAACQGAIACMEAVRATGMVDGAGLPLRLRIGINSGTALVGNIGSPTRLNYTAIGDSVNVASRLEAVNKIYGTDVIIGEETRRLAAKRIVVRDLDRIAVYGRSGGTAIYELIALCDEGERQPRWISIYEAALREFRARNWSGAEILFRRVTEERGNDTPSDAMLERCRNYALVPPEPGWTGVNVLVAK
jgi:adenylate cyclase